MYLTDRRLEFKPWKEAISSIDARFGAENND
jgi:hypothetical protein